MIIANWKMHGDLDMLRRYVAAYLDGLGQNPIRSSVVLCPPAHLLVSMHFLLTDSVVKMGGQDCASFASGAYTGQISAPMLKEAGATYCLVGHSEVRRDSQLSDAKVLAKWQQCHNNHLEPILCVGESANARQLGDAEEVVRAQIRQTLGQVNVPQTRVMVAYEPIWAIGSGQYASAEDIQTMHAIIRDQISQTSAFSQAQILILYGGSVKASNVSSIACLPEVQGVLVGGASLDVDEMLEVTRQCSHCFSSST